MLPSLHLRHLRPVVVIVCLTVLRFVVGVSDACQFRRETMYCQSKSAIREITDELASTVITFKLNIPSCDHEEFKNDTRLDGCSNSKPLKIKSGTLSKFKRVVEIKLSYNNIASVPSGEFCAMKNLTRLELNNNLIKHLSDIGFSSNCDITCGEQLQYLTLEYNNITAITNTGLCNLRDLKNLQLSGNNVVTVDGSAFVSVTKLSYLTLNNNSITYLPSNTFEHQRSLKYLEMENNKLGSLSDHLFSKLEILDTLTLKYNRVTTLNVDDFINLKQLRNLNLAHNAIVNITNGTFRNLNRLEFLYLNDNQLISIEENIFQGLYELVYLNLDDNMIEQIHRGTFDAVPNLTWLYLQNNKLKSVPNLNLHYINELYLSNNQIEVVDETTFAELSELQFLFLDKNHLEVLGDYSFQNQTNLEFLTLADNRLRQMGNASLNNLKNLASLNLENNKLDFLDNFIIDDSSRVSFPAMDVFMSLQALTHLNLSNNSITRFQYSWWPKQLHQLNVSSNHIKELNYFGIALIAIRIIDFSHNLLRAITDGPTFPETAERIFLANNIIANVNPNAFIGTPKLRLLVLDNNNLHNLELNKPEDLDQEIGIVRLRLANNPWKCDCHLQWLKDTIHLKHDSYYIEDVQKLVCSRTYYRNRDQRIPIYQANSGEDFMCKFSIYDMESCLTWQGAVGTICKHQCPHQCTCYRGTEWEIINIDCTANGLTKIPSNLHPATFAAFFDRNNISIVGRNDLQHLVYVNEIYLDNNDIVSIEEGSFDDLNNLERLFLQWNQITDLSPKTFVNTVQLIELDLSHNLLSNLSELLFSPLQQLDTLVLNNNKLYNFPVWTFRTLHQLQSIALQNNPWSCDCDYVAQYTNWMRDFARKLKFADEMYCINNESKPPQKISFISFNDSMCFSVKSPLLTDEQTIALVTSSSIIIIAVVVASFIFVYRHEMQVLVYSRYGVRLFYNVKEDANKVYDAFLSYSSLDEMFIVRELLPGLEQIENPYKVCLHHRDFPIGAFINESIFDAIEKSRRTILILSENFVNSEWCRFEFRTAHCQMIHDRCSRVIVIILGDIPKNLTTEMRLYLRTNTYLSWDDNLFWEKLYFALPEKTATVPEDEHQL